ncbi:type III secretion system domain-containing protein [Pandoraea sp. NPDC087047]|uniref:type III secretion system domain-containing protein n=1 Tax=Pandoraea sp. NPDC087047 TaxID=3364390 RepID=UPI0038262B48
MNAHTQLASLIWQPGTHMDAGWWEAFGMAAWRASYERHPACRAHVDRLLIARRGWPASALAPDCVPPQSDTARAMLRLVRSLRRVSLAHGLRMLGCPDYLLLGTYRRALSPWLDAWQCDRLLLTRRDWPSRTAYAPEQIADAALALTGARLDAAPVTSADDVATVRAAARILLPPSAEARALPLPDGTLVEDDIWPRLVALEKMLCMSSTLH